MGISYIHPRNYFMQRYSNKIGKLYNYSARTYRYWYHLDIVQLQIDNEKKSEKLSLFVRSIETTVLDLIDFVVLY